jgi:hypothetical protein
MAIRIVNDGISALNFAPSFDECVIESVVEHESSFVMDVRNGTPIYKRIRSDEEVSDYIANMLNHDEISSITMDEENRDIIINLRQIGQAPIEIEDDIPE